MILNKKIGDLAFSHNLSTIMHIDLNSCFATIEQQANPLLRNKPIAVATYTTQSAIILAPSIEAKACGIKTGMRVRDGKKLYPTLHIMSPDPDKYRHVHLQIRDLLSNYTNILIPQSIDEFSLDLSDYLLLCKGSMREIGIEIKQRIRKEVGDWLSVSVGIGPSRFLAKMASNIKKPDGLEEINYLNAEEVYSRMSLVDVHGINFRNKTRLNKVGIYSVLDFYLADLAWLKAAFASVASYYWYVRLRGWDIDNVEFGRRTFGNSYALPSSNGTVNELLPILQKLVEKTGSRLRRSGYKAQGVHLSLSFKDGTFWHRGQKLKRVIFDSRDIYKELVRLMMACPEIKPARILAESVFDLVNANLMQLDLFENLEKKKCIVDSIDLINQRWGEFSITPARMVTAYDKIPDRISFGGVKELISPVLV